MEQRSKEWFEARKGRFTASQIYRLMGKLTTAKGKQALDTYAFEKAVEVVYGLDEEQVISFDMQRGIDLEPMAFARFSDNKELDFLTVKESPFYPYLDTAGASPDGDVDDNSVLEIKCPRRNKFFKLIANGITEIDPKYIYQMQMQMMVTDTKRCYFFNYLIEDAKEMWHEIIVERDDVVIEEMKKRIEQAEEVKQDYIKLLKSNQQF